MIGSQKSREQHGPLADKAAASQEADLCRGVRRLDAGLEVPGRAAEVLRCHRRGAGCVGPDSEVVLRVLSDDAVLAERAVESGVLADLRKALQTSGDGLAPDRVQLINSFLIFAPFEIAGPCALRVRVLVGTDELRGVGLRIEEMLATD